MKNLLIFGFHSVNEFGQVNVGAYAQANPVSALLIGFGVVFLIYLVYKFYVQ
jgi:hypothetical protein